MSDDKLICPVCEMSVEISSIEDRGPVVVLKGKCKRCNRQVSRTDLVC